MLRMKVSRDQPPDAEILEGVSRALERGGIVAFPTETLYGLSVDPRLPGSLERLFHLKHRPRSRQVPFVAADQAQAQQLATLEGSLARKIAERFWPGPLTLVLPMRTHHPLAAWDWGTTLGIRVPGSALIRGLAAHAGIPLPATSVNLHGESPARDPAEFPEALLESIDLLLDAGRLPESLPSTVLSLASSRPRILRRGAVSEAELLAYLGVTSEEREATEA